MKKIIEWFKERNAGVIIGSIFTLISIYYFVKSFEYPYHNKFGVGPGLFPRWVAIIAIVAGICYVLQSIFRDKFIVGEIFPGKKELTNVFITLIAILGFVIITPYLGFCISSSLLMFVIFIRSYTWWKAILYAVVVSVAVFAIFRLGFSVPIPVNQFGF